MIRLHELLTQKIPSLGVSATVQTSVVWPLSRGVWEPTVGEERKQW